MGSPRWGSREDGLAIVAWRSLCCWLQSEWNGYLQKEVELNKVRP